MHVHTHLEPYLPTNPGARAHVQRSLREPATTDKVAPRTTLRRSKKPRHTAIVIDINRTTPGGRAAPDHPPLLTCTATTNAAHIFAPTNTDGPGAQRPPVRADMRYTHRSYASDGARRCR